MIIICNYDWNKQTIKQKQHSFKEECKKINNIISSYNIPLVLVEMDVSYCDFDESPSRDELIELSSLFDVEDIYIQTKQHGREKL